MPPPRLLADEMVGSLARYLRMLGCDTLYARGWSDEEIVRRGRSEDRVVLTRDRQLARRAERAVLLTSTRLEDQLRTTWTEVPGVPADVRFERCTLCNGRLLPEEAGRSPAPGDGVPWDRVSAGLGLFRCSECGHRYWDGSHTAEVRRRLRAWAAGRTV